MLISTLFAYVIRSNEIQLINATFSRFFFFFPLYREWDKSDDTQISTNIERKWKRNTYRIKINIYRFADFWFIDLFVDDNTQNLCANNKYNIVSVFCVLVCVLRGNEKWNVAITVFANKK